MLMYIAMLIILLITVYTHIIIDLLASFRLRAAAVYLLDSKFDEFDDSEERCIALGKFFNDKWDTLGAAKLLLRCRSATTAAIFNQWWDDNDSNFKKKTWKIMNIWLTMPEFNEEREKVIRIAKLILRSNRDIFSDLLKNMEENASSILLEKIDHHDIPRAMEKLSPHLTDYLLKLIKLRDEERYKQLLSSMNAEYTARVEEVEQKKFFKFLGEMKIQNGHEVKETEKKTKKPGFFSVK